jgi:uncharacterized integral membrane protein
MWRFGLAFILIAAGVVGLDYPQWFGQFGLGLGTALIVVGGIIFAFWLEDIPGFRKK